ncbi:M48 family metallopeptidase [Massilia sp. CF038]|uniref:M48 family metallopeptidase n=1 Tax=Massilia sp. CF038 TaxID=1881045 RepID=UPI0009194030|nr:M48 family metallopeptidase [Massilia sp. CF038]SHH39159.1 Zn-dependent protease with chaperone function [Massilia sp. CF038]
MLKSSISREPSINANFTAPPAELAALLTKPSPSYKNSARLAVAGLLLFVTVYMALAGWFLYTPYRVFFRNAGSDLGVIAWIMALCSLFIGVFMVKAIFSVKNAKPTDLHEITAKDQPRLFAYLFQLADAAGAPRPHKVFLSARVNAAVFYDLSLFNLIFPSRKNLEIGLALVNTVTLGELRAVLAHEFGHFAQRSMAVGRWVYVAQQIATHLVTRRDALDDFLITVGNIDLRVRAVVAVVQLIIWSIRSLVESLFNAVILMQRALSREMEMQADLVAVSLTGSDALIHALHRLQGADDAWDRALGFVHGEKANGRATRDVFAVQTHMLARMSAILNDDAYQNVPPLPTQGQDQHRIFKVELAQPPRMWLTHPLNHEREANAKKLYVAAPIDPASAWSLFDYPNLVREEMTGRLLESMEGEAQPVELEESLKTLGRQFKREHYNRRYCGIFFGRSLTRHAETYQALRDPARPALIEQLATLYPASLTADITALRALETEAAQIEALIAGTMSAAAKLVHVRGVAYRKKDLPAALVRVKEEIATVNGRLQQHDLLCRSWHQNTAARLGGGWQAYLDGLLALIHYAEHALANVQDAQGLLNNTTAVVTAVGKVSEAGVARVIFAANELHFALERAYQEAGQVTPDVRLRERLELQGSWQQAVGGFELGLCQRENIDNWLGVVDSWVRALANSNSALRTAALEELLVTETMIARIARSGESVDAAPAPSQAPQGYALLLPGAERKRQTKLDWWARFQRADGWLPGGARLLAAAAIVAAVLSASNFSAGHGTSVFSAEPALSVYNGLGVAVSVTVDGRSVTVAPGAHAPLVLPAAGRHHIEARSPDGSLIEQFDENELEGSHPVYNVAGAAPMVEWYAPYGSVPDKAPQHLGAPRWINSYADHRFEEPPASVSGSKYQRGSYRSILAGGAGAFPESQLGILKKDADRARLALTHARWDSTTLPDTEEWLGYASLDSGFAPVLADRLARTPDDVLLRRVQLDAAAADARAPLCAEAAARAAGAPDDGNRAYLALRCQREDSSAEARTRRALARWPENGWMRTSAAYFTLESANWADALPELEAAMQALPFRAPLLALNIARIQRYRGGQLDLAALAARSPRLAQLLKQERGEGQLAGPGQMYSLLTAGNLAGALNAAETDPQAKAYLLRLVAASDGASAVQIAQALALPPEQGTSLGSAWVMLAVAARQGEDLAARRAQALEITGRYGPSMMAFFDGVRKGMPAPQAERLLVGVGPELRAHAYAGAIVLLGKKAPDEWRKVVRTVLFAPERPYFI